jgi:S-adenosylmethionine:tRNA ribosyltransferase-isomerase
VVNDTRVIPARLFAAPKGHMKNRIEILLLRQREGMTWEAWCKPARRIHVGDELRFSDRLGGRVLEKSEGTIVMRFEGDAEEIERIGVMPLPPYISRPSSESDRQSYQTVYANQRGAIAAPTAGLHFTQAILDEIARVNEIVRITLHVGIGTFKPVKVDDIREHVMDVERYEIGGDAAASLNRALDEKRRVVAVGTTSVRTLESAIDEDGVFREKSGETRIFIRPPYEFRASDRLITNFHLPRSTLMMLVAAFAGYDLTMRAYQEAVAERYRLYSYGDAMVIVGD